NRRKHFNIQDYEKLLNVDFCLHDKAVILSYAHPLSTMYALYIQRTSGALGYRIQPFSDWAPKNSPFWWKAFTDLKHDRMTNFKKASLRNTIYALAAVFIIVSIMNEDLFCNGSVSAEIYNLFSIQYWNRTGSVMTGIPRYTSR